LQNKLYITKFTPVVAIIHIVIKTQDIKLCKAWRQCIHLKCVVLELHW